VATAFCKTFGPENFAQQWTDVPAFGLQGCAHIWLVTIFAEAKMRATLRGAKRRLSIPLGKKLTAERLDRFTA